MKIVRQGETYTFDFTLSGDDVAAFTYTMSVLQYPGDTPAISRELTVTDGAAQAALTSAETAALAVGQWVIHVQSADSDEDVRTPERIQIAKGWV